MKRSGTATRYTRSNFPKFVRAANVIGSAWKAYKGRAPAKTRSSAPKGGLQGVTTFQKDVKNVYRYKRAPRKLRKKWSRSRKTFTSNLLKAEGSRKYHYSGNMTWTTAVNQQGWFGWMNYGAAGTGGVDGSGDLADIQNRLDVENRLQGTFSDQAERGQNARRYYFDHMRARVVLTNTGTGPIFWEVYECYARKDVPITPEGGTLQQFFNFMSNVNVQGSLSTGMGQAGVAQSSTQTSGVSAPVKTTTGVTPFQFRHYCQNFKITKVTRLQAAAGNTVSFDCSDPRNVVVNWDNWASLLARKGYTKIYLVRQWGAITTISGTPQNQASSAVCEIEKDYNVKMLDQHVPQLNYFTYTNTTET